MKIPGSALMMFAGTRALHCDCSTAAEITRGKFESREQIRARMDLFRKIRPNSKLALETLSSAIGIREEGHIRSLYPLCGKELLAGMDFPDTIGCGTYPVDIHGNEDKSISFMRLTGEKLVYKVSRLVLQERWLPEGKTLPFYRIPLHCLIPYGTHNVICAGRMLDADPVAFGAVRVMVNLNQCGEARRSCRMAGHAPSLRNCRDRFPGKPPSADCGRFLLRLKNDKKRAACPHTRRI